MTERKPEWALYQPASSSKDCFSATASLPGLTITVTILFFCIFAPEASWMQLSIVNECGIISDAMEESTSFLVKAGRPRQTPALCKFKLSLLYRKYRAY